MSRPNELPELTEADFAPYAECDQELTDAQVSAIVECAYLNLLRRHRNSALSPEEERAFLAGAAVAFFACRSQLKLPAAWVFPYTHPERLLTRLARWKAEGKLHT